MASREKKNGGDFVLESRHLVGLFLLLVVIFGVVFTLGYLLGRSQYDTKLHAAVGKPADAEPSAPAVKAKGSPETNGPTPAQEKSNWEFYHSAEPKTTEDHLQPPPKTAAAAKPSAAPKPPASSSHPSVPAKTSAPLNAPLIPKGAIMLQVAAVSTEGDALAMAQALQQKKFPAYVITPSSDKYYRVQVGPYSDPQAATKARTSLEAEGFKSIIKR
ncbi:MAG: SPOR domain-containing protein [Candidatus Acidiferrales bacterium]|jgi:cell division septation protein DedD